MNELYFGDAHSLFGLCIIITSLKFFVVIRVRLTETAKL